MEKELIEKADEQLKLILEKGIDGNNLEHIYKLTKIRHMAKEDENMYGNYRGPGYDSYGNYGRGNYGEYGNYGRGYGEYNGYGAYGRRGRDAKYRGYGHLDEMYEQYGRYSEGKERYGASEETDKSFHYMVKALEDFIKVLEEEADTQQQKQQLHEALQNSMR